MNDDDDGKKRERRSLNPNLQIYIGNTSTTLHEWERNPQRNRPRTSLHSLTPLALLQSPLLDNFSLFSFSRFF